MADQKAKAPIAAQTNIYFVDRDLLLPLGELWLGAFRRAKEAGAGKGAAVACSPSEALEIAREYLMAAINAQAGHFPVDSTALVRAYVALNRVLAAQGDLEAARDWATRCAASGVWWEQPLQRPGHYLRGLLSKPWHDANDHEICRRLEAGFSSIKAEVLAVLEHATATDSGAAGWGRVGERAKHDGTLIENGEWREFVLLGDSKECKVNKQRCPFTANILSTRPEVVECAKQGVGEALFSMLRPGCKLKRHCGPTNVRLTCHLGLIIPEEAGCEITVGMEPPRRWQEGKCIVFDDSYEHFVENRTDKRRVVLLVNFWHPGVPRFEWSGRSGPVRAVEN